MLYPSRKQLAGFLIVLFLIPSSLNPISVAVDVPTFSDGAGYSGVPNTLLIAPERNYGWSSFFGFATDTSGRYECKGVDDPKCTAVDTTARWQYGRDLNAPKPKPDDPFLFFYHIMSICDETNLSLCVKDLTAIDPQGNRIVGKYLGKYQEKSKGDFEAVPEMNLSASKGKGLLFEFEGATHSGGSNLYMLNIYTGAALSSAKMGGDSLRNYKIKMENFTAELIPIRKELYGKGPNGQKVQPTFDNKQDSCYWMMDESLDPNWCPVPEAFPSNFRFGMTIVFPSKLAGWFHGRVSRPMVGLTTQETATNVTIEASPISIPQMNIEIPATSIPQRYYDILKKYQIQGAWNGPSNNGRWEVVPGGAISLKNPRYPLDMSDYFGATYETFGDRATFSQSVWRITSLGQEGISNQCKAEGFSGIVTTNALAYSSGPPEFNSQTQSLDYKVTSPHLDENGLLNRGSYDLVVESTLARCLYGLTDAPVSASISVISASGEAQVATTSVGQKAGYLYLSAQGFTYSTPTIRVQLSQEKGSNTLPTPSQSPSATPASVLPSPRSTSNAQGASKSVRIYAFECIKGKVIKKFTSTTRSKNSCPKGWKRA